MNIQKAYRGLSTRKVKKVIEKRILVTGGAGFIGSNLVDILIEQDNYVIVYDNFDKYYSGKERNIKRHEFNPNFTLLRADILDLKILTKAIKDVDIVFHLAAQPGVRFSMENPRKTSEVNIIGTINVLMAAKEAGVKKVIYASSSSVYGQPRYLPIDENHPTDPISIYGASKLAAEKYCQIFSHQLGLPVVMLRYHTVYGPRQRPDMAIHKWTRAIFESKPITIYGDGTQTRDFTYVDDIVDGTIRSAEVEDTDGEVFNLGGGTKVSVNKVVELLIEASGVDEVKVVYDPPKLGDVSDTHADITKAKKILGYNPKVGLEEGLSRFIKWYKDRTNVEN